MRSFVEEIIVSVAADGTMGIDSAVDFAIRLTRATCKRLGCRRFPASSHVDDSGMRVETSECQRCGTHYHASTGEVLFDPFKKKEGTP